MQVSVETSQGLERKVHVSVPSNKIEEEVNSRLLTLSRKAKVAGFRPGKVPMNIIRKRFSNGVREEVARDLVQSSLYEALTDHNLTPAGAPSIEPKQLAAGEDFTYTAIFEIFPEINIKEIEQAEIEKVTANVSDADVDTMISKLQEQHKTWQKVERRPQSGDKVILDYKGFIDNEAFAGGENQQQELVLGSNSFIPGFEEALIDKPLHESFDIQVTFPSDYNQAELAGKQATFTITLHEVQTGETPELNDDFAQKFNIKDGGITALKKDIKDNMVRELARRVSAMNRDNVFDALMQANPFDLPKALVDKEIEHLNHEMYHRIFGTEHKDDEQIPELPRELFIKQAERRVHLGLLFAEYVKAHEIKPDEARVNQTIETLAQAYENPEELKQWYQGNKERLADVESLVMEEMVAEKAAESANVVLVEKTYDDIMNSRNEDNA